MVRHFARLGYAETSDLTNSFPQLERIPADLRGPVVVRWCRNATQVVGRGTMGSEADPVVTSGHTSQMLGAVFAVVADWLVQV